ncbi:MAG TPA: energy transducer TonB [Myxococcota bacterium]|jgi:protein TonB
MRHARAWALAAAALAAAAAPMRAGEPLHAPESARGEVDLVAMPPSVAERLEQIRQRVQAAVVYPAAARERGIQGVARIRFRVDPAGRASEVITVESSGSPMLDTAAEDAARNARELPQLYGWVQIPVRFELERRTAMR